MNCFWIIIGKYEDDTKTWIQNMIHENETIQDFLRTIYISGIYYIITTIATVGYGDISCATLFEMMYTCFCMFFGIALFAFIQGGLVDAIKKSLLSGEIKEAKYQDEFQTWLIQREQNIVNPLAHKKLKLMRECTLFKFKYEFSTNIFETEYFQYLPPYEQQELFLFYFTEITNLYSSFFRNISEISIIKQIVANFKPLQQFNQIFNQSELIFKLTIKSLPKDGIVQSYSTKSKGLYFIFKGKVLIEQQVINQKGDKNECVPFRELSQGSFFGELCLIDKKSKFNFKVSDEEDLYCFFIKKEKIFKLCEQFPQILKQLMRFTHFRYKYFKIEGDRIKEKQIIFNSLQQVNNNQYLFQIQRIKKIHDIYFLEFVQNYQFLNLLNAIYIYIYSQIYIYFSQPSNKKQNLRDKSYTRQLSRDTKLFNQLQEFPDPSNANDELTSLSSIKKTKKNKLNILNEIQKQSDIQIKNIFKQIQNKNLIVNLYHQILQIQHKIQLNAIDQKGIDGKNTSIEYVKDIFQEQFEEDCTDSKSPKYISLRQPRSNFLSIIGEDQNLINYDYTKDNIGEVFSPHHTRLQSNQTITKASIVSYKHSQQNQSSNYFQDILNFENIKTESVSKLKSLSISSQQGNLQALQKSRLSLIKENSKEKNQINSPHQRSNSLQARRNGILQSMYRENNQQTVHKRSSSDFQTSPFAFSPYQTTPFSKLSVDNINLNNTINNSFYRQNSYSINNNNFYRQSTLQNQIPFNKQNTIINYDNLFFDNEEGDGQNKNDVKFFKAKSNKKDEYQNFTLNTQIFTNPIVTLNTEGDHLLTQMANLKTGVSIQSNRNEQKNDNQKQENQQSSQYDDIFYQQNHQNTQQNEDLASGKYDEFKKNKNNNLNIQQEITQQSERKDYNILTQDRYQQNQIQTNQQSNNSIYNLTNLNQKSNFENKNNDNINQQYFNQGLFQTQVDRNDFINEEKNNYSLRNNYQESSDIVSILIGEKKNIFEKSPEETQIIADMLIDKNQEQIQQKHNTNTDYITEEDLQNKFSNILYTKQVDQNEQINLETQYNKNDDVFNNYTSLRETIKTSEATQQQVQNFEVTINSAQSGNENNYTYPMIFSERESEHDKIRHIPTEYNDYINILQNNQSLNTLSNIKGISGSMKKSFKERFLQKNYFEQSKKKQQNQKKMFQQQLESIVNEAEQETSRRSILINQSFNLKQEQPVKKNQSRFNFSNISNQIMNINNMKSEENEPVSNLQTPQNKFDSQNNFLAKQDNLNLNNQEANKKKATNTKKQIRRNDSQELTSTLNKFSQVGNRAKSLSHYIKSAQFKQMSGNLSNFSALIKILQLDKRFKKGKQFNEENKKQDQSEENLFLAQKQQNPSTTNQKSFSHLNDKNEDQIVVQTLNSFTDIQQEQDEPEFQDDLLDNSFDVPIELIEPSFILEEFYQVIPYLNNQMQRLENRLDKLLDNIEECGKFCEEKMVKIKNIKDRKQQDTSQNKDINKKKVLLNLQKIKL